jgi:hypothetical protein
MDNDNFIQYRFQTCAQASRLDTDVVELRRLAKYLGKYGDHTWAQLGANARAWYYCERVALCASQTRERGKLCYNDNCLKAIIHG